MSTTTDRTDPRLAHGTDEEPREQAEVYLVLSEEERALGFVRPLRRTYRHSLCASTTVMALAIAETYARAPGFYTGTWCATCKKHRPLSEFTWLDGSAVGS